MICPRCKIPLLETTDGRFLCVFCMAEIGRLTGETMKRMVDDFPEQLLKEWLIEIEASPTV